MTIRMRDLLMAGAALVAMRPAVAQADAAAANDVSEVVVTGQLEQTLPQTLSQYGNRLVTVDGQVVRDRLYADVGQVLQNEVPGLSLIPQAGPFSYNNASLQGSRSSEILYLVDGVRISNRLYNTTPPLDTVPAHMVERVEVLQGGQGLFYGTQGVAGVINIVTRDFTDHLAGRVEAGGDTNEAWTANGYVSDALGPHHFLAFASHDEARGYQVFPDSEYQPSGTDRHRGYAMTSVGGKYRFDATDALKLTLSYTHTEGHAELPRPNLVSDAHNDRNEEIAYGKVDWDISDAFSLYVKGYWHDWQSHYDQTNNTPAGPVVVDDHEKWQFRDQGVNALGRYVVMPGLELWGGYDYQRYNGFDDVLIIAPQKETAQAVFGQVRITPDLLPRTHLAAGVRSNFVKGDADATIWNVSGDFEITDQLFVRGTAGAGFRLPDAESLFAQDPLNNGEIGNPDLKAERSKNLNLSLGYRGKAWQAELIGFARSTKDLISLDGETPDPDVFTFINLPGRVKVRGVELDASGEPADWLSLAGSFTASRTRLDGALVQLTDIPKSYGHVSADVHPADRKYGGGAILNWVGDVYGALPSGLGVLNRGNYAVLDLNAWIDVGPGRLAAKLENVTDNHYSVLLRRYFTDVGARPYVGHFRGVPRTLHVSYAYSF